MADAMVKDVILVVIMVARAAKLVLTAKNAIAVLVTVVQNILLYQDVMNAMPAMVAIAVDIAILVMIALNVLAVFIVLINVIPMIKLTVWQQNTKTKMSDVKLVEHAMGVSTAMQNAISGMD